MALRTFVESALGEAREELERAINDPGIAYWRGRIEALEEVLARLEGSSGS